VVVPICVERVGDVPPAGPRRRPRRLAEADRRAHRRARPPKFARQAAEGRADAYIAAIAGDAIQIDDPPDPPSVSPDDCLFALARAAGAEVIVSGDSHLTALAASTPPVRTPRQFAGQLASE
jgi:hypothetical protein